MSIQSELTRIRGLRDTLRTKLADLGLVQSTADLADCVTAVEAVENRGGVTGSISDKSTPYSVPAGYHNGTGTVSIAQAEQQKLLPGNIKQGVTILGVEGTYTGDTSSVASALAANLSFMGVALTGTETLEELVTLVLRIPQGDTSLAVFRATVSPGWDVSYGYFGPGEVAELAGMVTVDAICRSTAIRLTITGSGAGTLLLTGQGWEVTADAEADILTATYAAPAGITRFEAQTALDRVQITGDGATPVNGSIRVASVTDSGEVLEAEGSASLTVRYALIWAVLDGMRPTWAELEGKTWAEIETMGKPQTGGAQ